MHAGNAKQEINSTWPKVTSSHIQISHCGSFLPYEENVLHLLSTQLCFIVIQFSWKWNDFVTCGCFFLYSALMESNHYCHFCPQYNFCQLHLQFINNICRKNSLVLEFIFLICGKFFFIWFRRQTSQALHCHINTRKGLLWSLEKLWSIIKLIMVLSPWNRTIPMSISRLI